MAMPRPFFFFFLFFQHMCDSTCGNRQYRVNYRYLWFQAGILFDFGNEIYHLQVLKKISGRLDRGKHVSVAEVCYASMVVHIPLLKCINPSKFFYIKIVLIPC